MPEPAAFERIMVAVGDGSRAAQLVVSVAGLASAGAADVLLVYVSDCSVCCGATDHPALHEHERELLQSLVDGLCARGVRARSELRVTASGRVAAHLLDAAADWRADLLVAAAGRPGPLRGRPWRRVLAKLLNDAECPVLVLPRHPHDAQKARGRYPPIGGAAT
ncbi:MAG TPA: universal stress protein [Terriglobales bacterium]|nr:universal stress protein [Terriglobales bacterium]